MEKNLQTDVKKDEMIKSSQPSKKFKRANTFAKPGKANKRVAQEKCYGNDPSWYSSDSALVSSSAALSFFNPVGEPITNVLTISGTERVDLDVKTPGILRIPYVPTVGLSRSGSSAINLASIKLYSYVRHANSGSRVYERADQTMIYVAIMNLVATLAHATRVYGLAQLYNKFNRYYPKAIINSMFGNVSAFDNLINNLPAYLFKLNTLINKCSSLAIPKGMSVLDRWAWMNSTIWLDAPNSKSMLFYYIPSGLYKFNATDPTGTKLDFVRFNPSMANPMDLLSVIEDALNALVTDEDVGIICGDIIKAFGVDNLVTLNSVPTDYVVQPEYSLEVLTQVQHIYTFGQVKNDAGSGAIAISQSGGNILTNYAYENPLAGKGEIYVNKYLLTMPTDTPTEGDVLVATRLLANCVLEDAELPVVAIESCGTELIEQMSIWTLNNGVVSNINFQTFVGINFDTLDIANFKYYMQLTGFLDKMDYHPPVYFVTNSATAKTWQMDLLCDYDYYTVMGTSDINKLHDTAVLNEFSIASISTTLGYK